jgi:hypothetical protein
MNASITLFRSVLVICFIGLMTACGSGEKPAESESSGHGHSHE